ncbi:Uncharacterised protein [Shigella sonnei]|nr:Uncharacterised protein [Shigella sonnei]
MLQGDLRLLNIGQSITFGDFKNKLPRFNLIFSQQLTDFNRKTSLTYRGWRQINSKTVSGHLRSVFSHKLQRMLNDPHVDTRR